MEQKAAFDLPLSHLPPMPEEMIGQDASDHGFADWDGANADAGIVATFGQNFALLTVAGDRATRTQNR